MEYEERNLYGGAIRLTLPKCFDDISKIRDVPDHQEVFVDQYSECSIIIELLDMTDIEINENKVAEYYFKDISEFNCSKDIKTVYSEPLNRWSDDILVSKCYGIQNLEKRYANIFCKEKLNLYILVLRIVSKKTDIVISFNDPIKDENNIQFANEDSKTTKSYSHNEISEIMDKILKTFTIKDYKLFI